MKPTELTKNQKIAAFANEIMRLDDLDPKKCFIEKLAVLDESGWTKLLTFARETEI